MNIMKEDFNKYTKKRNYLKFLYLANIYKIIADAANNSSISGQIDLIHFPYGTCKYDNDAINTILVGAINIVNPYIDCQINPIIAELLAVVDNT